MEQKSAKKAKTIQTWYYLPPEILPDVLSHFDVKTLVEKKQVSKNWYTFCTGEIDTKRTKAFQTNKELNDAVRKYCGCKDYDKPDLTGWIPRARYDADLAEEFACTYGYPMNNWNASKVEDFYGLFAAYIHFNENISSWEVSQATTMEAMFHECRSFNQDISKWNVSNVTNMTSMFAYCSSFNQNLSRWNVSRVVAMKHIFWNATAFHQDIDSWPFWDAEMTW